LVQSKILRYCIRDKIERDIALTEREGLLVKSSGTFQSGRFKVFGFTEEEEEYIEHDRPKGYKDLCDPNLNAI
jgi:hypothetical protein